MLEEAVAFFAGDFFGSNLNLPPPALALSVAGIQPAM